MVLENLEVCSMGKEASKMKKYLGAIAMLFIFAVVVGSAAVKAYTSPDFVGVTYSGVKYAQYNKETVYYTKNRGSSQSVYVNKAYTSLTNPCTECQIAFKLTNDNGTVFSGAAAKMYETQTFSGNTEAYGNYKLKMMRADFTLLDTTVTFKWNLNI